MPDEKQQPVEEAVLEELYAAEPSSPPIRKNVLILACGIVVVAGGSMTVLGFTTGNTVASVMGVAGMAIGPLAMMAKELLTPEPGPTVSMPANTFVKLIQVIRGQ